LGFALLTPTYALRIPKVEHAQPRRIEIQVD
jgi:hypothetical protein